MRPRRTDGFLPIEDYALIGDGQRCALVGADGSIDWLCVPRFDSPSVFGRILDARAGHFAISLEDLRETQRRYRAGTNVLETRLHGDHGTVEVVDLLAVAGEDAAQPETRNTLVRSVRCLAGEASVRVELAPRPGYASEPTDLRASGGAVSFTAGGRALVLASSEPLEVQGDAAVGRSRLRAGDRVDLALSLSGATPRAEATAVDRAITETEGWWRRWSQRLTYEGPYRNAVERSALTLKLLDDARTGAIIAAPTTSLPEGIGGARNWDYRYAWIRDVAFGVYALRQVGCLNEAAAFLDWALLASRCDPDSLAVLYAVDGAVPPPERSLEELSGYRGSSPVRVGNAAAAQVQHDVFGELLDAFHLVRRGGISVEPAMWQCIRAHVDRLVDRWATPDRSIWEVRGPPQRFTYSAAMSQVAFDRAIRAAEEVGLPADLHRWRRERDRAAAAVDASWSDRLGAFARTIGGDDLDASLLSLPLRRVIGARDPRMRSTVEAVRRGLGAGGALLYRYLAEDGLPGEEGAFLICSFWLVDCLALRGDGDEATVLFEELLGYANDVGLLPEQVDPGTGSALGNFPQAFSHIGVIAAAVNLDRLRR